MDIWIIEDGEKTGPLTDFEVRRRIADGRLDKDVPAWHEGMKEWRKLGELPRFEREFPSPFQSVEAIDLDDAVENEPAQAIPPLPPPRDGGEAHLGRRFWARWFDLYVFAGVWWVLMAVTGQDVAAALVNPWVILLQYVPWFVLETFLLQRFGTTPGKWLMDLKVFNEDGSLLSPPQAAHRSMRVLFVGLGMGLGPVSLVCQLLSFITARRFGRPVWDHAAGHRLIAAPLHPVKVSLYVIGLFIALLMQFIVVMPHVFEDAARRNPEMRVQLEELKQAWRKAREAAQPPR